MLDPTLERRLSDCKELVAHWKTFHEFFKIGVKGQDITPDKEAQFLNIKSKLAMLHDSFIESLTHDQNIGQNIITIVARCITLKHVHRLGPADIKKMEIEWHESYLLLNETVALLEEKKEAMDKINPTQYKMQKFRENLSMNIKWFFTSIYFKLIIGLCGLIFILFGVPMLGIYDYKNLRTTPLKPVYDIGAGFYRMVNSTYPYDDVEQVTFNKSILGSQFQSQNDPVDEDILRNIRGILQEMVDKIMASKKGFRGKYYMVNGNPLMWGEFLLGTTAEAAECVTMFKNWFDPLTTSQKNNPNSPAAKLIIFNQRNVLVVMYFHPNLRNNAQMIQEQGFKVKL